MAIFESTLPSLSNLTASALSRGIENLAQSKLEEMQYSRQLQRQNQMLQQQAPALQALFPNYNLQQLQSLASLDPKLQQEALRGSRQQQEATLLGQLLSGGGQQMPPPVQWELKGQQGFPQPTTATPRQPVPQGQPQIHPMQDHPGVPQGYAQPQVQPAAGGQLASGQTLPPPIDYAGILGAAPNLGQKLIPALQRGEALGLQRAGIEQRGRIGEKKLEQEEEKLAIATQGETLKDIETKGKAAPLQIANYKEVLRLIKSGELRGKLLNTGLKKLGLEGLADNPASEAFRTIVNNEVFETVLAGGARNFSDEDRRQLESTFPNMMQTDAGKEFAAENKLRIAELNDETNKVRAKLVKQHGNRIYRGLLDDIEETVQPARDKYARETRDSISRILIATNPKAYNYGSETEALPDPSTFSGEKRFVNSKGEVITIKGTKPIGQ